MTDADQIAAFIAAKGITRLRQGNATIAWRRGDTQKPRPENGAGNLHLTPSQSVRRLRENDAIYDASVYYAENAMWMHKE